MFNSNEHPIQGFVGKTIDKIVDDGGNFAVKFTDGTCGTIHMNFPADTLEENEVYKTAFNSGKLYVVAGLYPNGFVPNVLK
ncbi:hypothetical protein [Desulfopila inferna]|uniref:hypothetical protein n=1 Tax=Desulfopila inferna TaxID=468528 RepID=UPI001965BD95|nr:hypothetical protein [Desulfopila inferna]MBM9606256.1 hypothetical protein [Desulfopila inferna]